MVRVRPALILGWGVCVCVYVCMCVCVCEEGAALDLAC